MWLEADSLGPGGVWLGIAPHGERMQKMETALGISSQLRTFALLCVGYPKGEHVQKDRFDATRVHRA